MDSLSLICTWHAPRRERQLERRRPQVERELQPVQGRQRLERWQPGVQQLIIKNTPVMRVCFVFLLAQASHQASYRFHPVAPRVVRTF